MPTIPSLSPDEAFSPYPVWTPISEISVRPYDLDTGKCAGSRLVQDSLDSWEAENERKNIFSFETIPSPGSPHSSRDDEEDKPIGRELVDHHGLKAVMEDAIKRGHSSSSHPQIVVTDLDPEPTHGQRSAFDLKAIGGELAVKSQKAAASAAAAGTAIQAAEESTIDLQEGNTRARQSVQHTLKAGKAHEEWNGQA